MIEVDESSARAIIEHARNLSGSAVTTVGEALISGSAAPPAQFPSESGHWYDSKTGNQVELPPRTQTRTALKRGYVPGVTTITKVAHKEAIQRWMVNRAIKFSAEILRVNPDPDFELSDDALAKGVWDMLNADSDAITGRGKELHAAIETEARHRPPNAEWDAHCHELWKELSSHGIDLYSGNTEHSFATSRYGGKIDWHNDEWLLDFKTKPRIEDGKKLAYPEHAQQLAAYDRGIQSYRAGPMHWETVQGKRRCANVFIGVEDAKVVFHEWSEKDLRKGLRKFEALLNVWWSDYEH